MYFLTMTSGHTLMIYYQRKHEILIMEIYKEIFEAAKEYGFSTFGDSFFKDRAKWEAEHPQGLNDVWHEGSEEPQNNRLLLILFENNEICYFCNISR